MNKSNDFQQELISHFDAASSSASVSTPYGSLVTEDTQYEKELVNLM